LVIATLDGEHPASVAHAVCGGASNSTESPAPKSKIGSQSRPSNVDARIVGRGRTRDRRRPAVRLKGEAAIVGQRHLVGGQFAAADRSGIDTSGGNRRAVDRRMDEKACLNGARLQHQSEVGTGYDTDDIGRQAATIEGAAFEGPDRDGAAVNLATSATFVTVISPLIVLELWTLAIVAPSASMT
jgi:hypothetical protein